MANDTTIIAAASPETRQVRRARERHEAKVAASEAAGRKYPESKYRPEPVSGKQYTSNGAAEVARRSARFA